MCLISLISLFFSVFIDFIDFIDFIVFVDFIKYFYCNHYSSIYFFILLRLFTIDDALFKRSNSLKLCTLLLWP
ncbi:hypothetical protein BD560DRAFT_113019 [Blakeslea trispora]|nr:hypothetical protein BD560DRAFT_113019 [Blakeslea trispora]